MRPFEQLALGAQGLGRAVRELFRPALWAAFAPLAVVEVGLVVALTVPSHPAFAWAFAPLVARLAGERALHFPDGFRALPGLFARGDAVLLWLVGSLVAGAATHAFATFFRGGRPQAGAALAAAVARWPALALATLPAHLLLAALGFVAARTPGGGLGGILAPPLFAIARAAILLAALYLPALVMLERRGAPRALAALPRAWARGLLGGLLPCAVALLPPAILGGLLANPAPLVERGTPELVATLLGVRVALGLVAWFVALGAGTLVFLGAVEERA